MVILGKSNFWKTVKSSRSVKVNYSVKKLGGKEISKEKINLRSFILFSSLSLKTSNIKYRTHPTIMNVKRDCNLYCSFQFSSTYINNVEKYTRRLITRKALQNTKIPGKICARS